MTFQGSLWRLLSLQQVLKLSLWYSLTLQQTLSHRSLSCQS
jgi:hypothetical protein